MGAEMAEGRRALVLDLHAVGALLGFVGPEPLLLDLGGHLGGPDLHLATVESPEDDHEVGHVDLGLGRLWFERAHGEDLPFRGWGTGGESYLAGRPARTRDSLPLIPRTTEFGSIRPIAHESYRGAVANEPVWRRRVGRREGRASGRPRASPGGQAWRWRPGS